MKGGIGWKLITLTLVKALFDVPVSRNWYKTVLKLYESSYM